MDRPKILFMILMFCSVMLVFYAAVQYWEAGKNKKASEKIEEELGEVERQSAEYRITRDSLRSALHKCCTDSIQKTSK
jgi:Flp pilus assembly protein TadB